MSASHIDNIVAGIFLTIFGSLNAGRLAGSSAGMAQRDAYVPNTLLGPLCAFGEVGVRSSAKRAGGLGSQFFYRCSRYQISRSVASIQRAGLDSSDVRR